MDAPLVHQLSRQWHSLSLIHIFCVRNPKGVVNMASIRKRGENSYLPVSYTHLDVYKRQVQTKK